MSEQIVTEIPLPTNPRFQNLTRKKYGRWTVISFAGKEGGKSMWFCKCECGARGVIGTSQLNGKQTQSCGCLRNEVSKTVNFKHGLTETKEFRTWMHIIERCETPTCNGYERYGGRGIKICAGWRFVFMDFFRDMGLAPTPKHSIDRKDNNGHYSCGHCAECVANGWTANCRWATQRQQGRNTSVNRLIEFRGETKPLVEWAEQFGFPRKMLELRLKRGWSIEKALTHPRLPNRWDAGNPPHNRWKDK